MAGWGITGAGVTGGGLPDADILNAAALVGEDPRVGEAAAIGVAAVAQM